MFEDDEFDDSEIDGNEDEVIYESEADEWYDNNLRYFDREGKPLGMPLEVEWFYDQIYKPFKSDLKKPVTEMVGRHYPFIGTEMRPEVLERIAERIDFVGHEFLLFLHQMIEYRKSGIDLHEKYPDLDKWAVQYPNHRKPHYQDDAFWDKMDWLTPELKAELIAESKKDADEYFEIKEKPRFEFFSLIQHFIFQYYPEVMEMDSDGWTLYEVFLHNEYTNYQLDFEHYDGFIDYGFGVADLDITYEEYRKKYSEKWNLRHDEEMRRREEDSN